ncbi:MAG: fibronectin/fibrinogen-binding protein [Firmicutes bacterium]|nr:fibronectin/fibrinogen-binding protein [Bacillota bacterium]
MAFDGIVTMAVASELQSVITTGKIDKVYQPETDELVFNIHTKSGNVKLFASANSASSRVHLIEDTLPNPPAPLSFCMLLRKHIQGARITDVSQKGSERILEISLETLNELGFTVSKKLIFEIMGKHSNIVLTDIATGKIIDCIKHISIDVNRIRQLLPGVIYQYPPAQDKLPFKQISHDTVLPADSKSIQRSVAGISPALAEEIAAHNDKAEFLLDIMRQTEQNESTPTVYSDDKNSPKEFHIIPLSEYEDVCQKKQFNSISKCLEYFYSNKQSTNKVRQKSLDLIRAVSSQLDKLHLKEQRLREDLLKAENSDDLRLYGELLTANIHAVKPGADNVEVINYYDGSTVHIPLEPRFSPSKNAQNYFKKYGKAKTAIKEKQLQLEYNDTEISYLDSVLAYLENCDDLSQIDELRKELEDTGYLRRRKIPGGFKEKKFKAEPYKYTLKDGSYVLVGKNNKENDILTFKTASSQDLWFHTKDIPGSHVILKIKQPSEEPDADTIYQAASVAAYHSKGRTSENVPVDYVKVKYVKKPAAAKPGMVIFTNNKTVWVNPKLP